MKDQLPEYMQVCYQALLDLYSEFEAEMSKEGRSESMFYVKEAVGLCCKLHYALRMLFLLVNLCSCQFGHFKLANATVFDDDFADKETSKSLPG